MAVTIASGSGSVSEIARGASAFRRGLKQAGDDLEDLKDTNRRVASVVEDATVGLVPVVSGWLASTIRSSGTKTAATVRVGNASVPYAGPIHWGWPARNIESQPFAADAAKLTEPVWGPIYQQAVEKAIDRIKGA